MGQGVPDADIVFIAVGTPPRADGSADLFMDLEILAVGGIDLNNIDAFISAGAMGVGIGTKLAGRDIVGFQDYELLGRRTKQYLQKIQLAKSTT